MIVIIHGPPAAGKSTLACGLSEALAIPVLSRDALAEQLHDAIPSSDGQSSSADLQHRAHDLMLERLAAAANDGESLIVEATLNPEGAAPRLVSLLGRSEQRVFEVFVEAPADVLVHRYRQRGHRGRHRVHRDAQRESQLAAHLRACRYRPLGIGHPLVRVDTDVPPGEVLALVLDAIDPAHRSASSADREKVQRRVYYDHEPAYRRVAARGGSGWDDRTDDRDDDSYLGLDAFLTAFGRTGRFASVLELGCGGGQAALHFAELADRIVGIDYSPTAIDLARKNARSVPHAHFEVGDVTKLEHLDERFDVVLDNHVLHCLIEDDHRADMLAAVQRVLTPRGLFFSETMSRHGRFDPAHFGLLPPRFVDPNRTRRWIAADELDQELRAAGLAIIERRVRPPAPDDPPVGDLLWTVARRA